MKIAGCAALIGMYPSVGFLPSQTPSGITAFTGALEPISFTYVFQGDHLNRARIVFGPSFRLKVSYSASIFLTLANLRWLSMLHL